METSTIASNGQADGAIPVAAEQASGIPDLIVAEHTKDAPNLIVTDVPTGVSLVVLPVEGEGAAPAPSYPSTAREPAVYRAENIYTDDLSPKEIEALFAAQATTQPPRVGSTAVMGQSDMDRLVSSLGGDAEGTSSYAWLPTWAKDKPRTYPSAAKRVYASTYSADDVYAEDTYGDDVNITDVHRIVIDLETTAATIDDTTVDTRDKVRDLIEDVKSLQIQANDVEESTSFIKAQNTALTEEVRELRREFVTMRNHVATLIRLLTVPKGPLAVPLASAQPGPADGPGAHPPKGDETVA